MHNTQHTTAISCDLCIQIWVSLNINVSIDLPIPNGTGSVACSTHIIGS